MTRENAKKQLMHIIAFLNPQLDGADIKALNMAIDALEEQPSVSAETWGEISGAWTVRFAPNEPSRKGHWIDALYSRKCSECGYDMCKKDEWGQFIPDKACPSCGCRMVGDAE